MVMISTKRSAETGSILHKGATETVLLMSDGDGHALRAENSTTYVQNSVVCPERTVAEVAFDAYLEGFFESIELRHRHTFLARPRSRQSVADVLWRQPMLVVEFGDPPILIYFRNLRKESYAISRIEHFDSATILLIPRPDRHRSILSDGSFRP